MCMYINDVCIHIMYMYIYIYIYIFVTQFIARVYPVFSEPHK